VYAMKKLSEIPGLRLIGTTPHKVSVLSFVLDGIADEEVGRHLNQEGIAARAGHHCAPNLCCGVLGLKVPCGLRWCL